jgi:hypothetical protein
MSEALHLDSTEGGSHYDEIPPYLMAGGAPGKVVRILEGDEDYPAESTGLTLESFGPMGTTAVQREEFWPTGDDYDNEKTAEAGVWDLDATGAVPAVRRAVELELESGDTEELPGD